MSNNSAISPVIPFPHTPVTPGNEREREAEAAAAAAAAPGGRAHARTREGLEAVEAYYCATFERRTCAPCVARELAAALEAGMEPETIMLAMDAAMGCERPSWAYASAVIRGCIADKALTPEEFAARSDRHRARRQPRREAAQGGGGAGAGPMNFQQRDYKPGELDHIYVDWRELVQEGRR